MHRVTPHEWSESEIFSDHPLQLVKEGASHIGSVNKVGTLVLMLLLIEEQYRDIYCGPQNFMYKREFDYVAAM